MKKFNTFALVISKVLEVIHWVGTAMMLFLFFFSIAAKDLLCKIIVQGVPEFGTGLTTYGFELIAVNTDGTINPMAITLFSIGAVVILSLMAMVFRNVYLIFKTAKGKTSFSKGDTPFQKDITRMIREIGIFYISVPVVGLIMSIISRIVLGIDVAEISVNFEGVITGILILCLSQVFAYGTQLQEDVDGLL